MLRGLESETFGNTDFVCGRLVRRLSVRLVRRLCPVRESIDVCVCRPDGDGVPPGNAGLIVQGSEDPDLVLDKVLMTAAVTLRECHLSRPPTVAFLKTGGCVSPK